MPRPQDPLHRHGDGLRRHDQTRRRCAVVGRWLVEALESLEWWLPVQRPDRHGLVCASPASGRRPWLGTSPPLAAERGRPRPARRRGRHPARPAPPGWGWGVTQGSILGDTEPPTHRTRARASRRPPQPAANGQRPLRTSTVRSQGGSLKARWPFSPMPMKETSTSGQALITACRRATSAVGSVT